MHSSRGIALALEHRETLRLCSVRYCKFMSYMQTTSCNTIYTSGFESYVSRSLFTPSSSPDLTHAAAYARRGLQVVCTYNGNCSKCTVFTISSRLM